MTGGDDPHQRQADAPSKGRILIIDDDRDFAAGLNNLLTAKGYGVALALGPGDARDVLQRFDAEVALFDIRLERGNGLDLIAPLKEARPGLVFIVTTGHADITMAIVALRQGAYDFLRKPIERDELLATLERCFGMLRLQWEKQQTERVLRESEEQLGLITDNLPVLISYIDAEQRFRFVNRTCETWYGRPSSEIVGKLVREIHFESAREKYRPRIEAVLSGQDVTYEEVIRYPDGTRQNVRISYVPHFDSDRRVQAFFAVAIDVTEKKLAESALRESEERLRGIVENSVRKIPEGPGRPLPTGKPEIRGMVRPVGGGRAGQDFPSRLPEGARRRLCRARPGSARIVERG